jgi:hypothetical protein
MGLFEEIKKNEIQILDIRNRIESENSNRMKNKLGIELKKLEYNQETSIMNYLEESNRSYELIVQENFDLLINDKIEFVVMSEQNGMFASHAVEMNGSVHNNGFFYGYTSETDASMFKITKHFFPSSYTGTINYLGESELRVSQKKFKFFGSRVPQKYRGSIDYYGNLTMDTIDTFFELDGDIFVTSIIADLFSGNSEKRDKFLNNRNLLYNIIQDLRNEIRTR